MILVGSFAVSYPVGKSAFEFVAKLLNFWIAELLHFAELLNFAELMNFTELSRNFPQWLITELEVSAECFKFLFLTEMGEILLSS
jgi:hypothetical protein